MQYVNKSMAVLHRSGNSRACGRIGDTIQSLVGRLPSLELLTVVELRGLSRIVVPVPAQRSVAEIASTFGLNLVWSDFGFIEDPTSFNNNTPRTPKPNRRISTIYAYVGTDYDEVSKCKVLDQQLAHRDLGLLLRYPECCVDFFLRYKKLSEARFNDDYSAISLRQGCSGSDSWMIDTMHRKHGYALISHFPCSFNCRPSIAIAQSRNMYLSMYGYTISWDNLLQRHFIRE